MMKINLPNKKAGGYTLIELLFYIGIFAIIAIAVINALITMTRAFRETNIQREFGGNSAIMERMTREIRKAYDISSISSNDLKLNTTDDTGTNKTVEFFLSGTNLQLLENNVLTGNLNSPNIKVTSINFTQVTTTNSKAIKISLTVQSINDALARSVDFYNTVVLRGSY